MWDAAELTPIGRGARGGLATRLRARPDASSLAILGVGEQARSHLAAMLSARKLRRIRVWGRERDKAAAFAQAEGAKHGVSIEVSATPREAVTEADIICTVTKAREPILLGEWIEAAAHLNRGGSSIRDNPRSEHPPPVEDR